MRASYRPCGVSSEPCVAAARVLAHAGSEAKNAALVAAAQEDAHSATRALDSEIAGARMREAEARQAEREAGRRAQEALEKAATTDELTGLLNRRAMLQLLELEVQRVRRSQRSFSLVFTDVDHFKAINDTYGHLAGSAALQEVGELLRAVGPWRRRGDLLGDADRLFHAQVGRRAHDLRAEDLHDRDLLARETFGNHDHDAVAALREMQRGRPPGKAGAYHRHIALNAAIERRAFGRYTRRSEVPGVDGLVEAE